MVHSEGCLTYSIPWGVERKQMHKYKIAACKHVYSKKPHDRGGNFGLEK